MGTILYEDNFSALINPFVPVNLNVLIFFLFFNKSGPEGF